MSKDSWPYYGQCLVTALMDDFGKERKIEIVQADEWIKISLPLLQELNAAFAEFTDDGVLKIHGEKREVHYQVGMELDDFDCYVGKKIFDVSFDD